MRIIGVDPGTLNMGYGIIDEEQGKLEVVSYGVIKVSTKVPIEEKLHNLYHKLSSIMDIYKPDEVAIEEPFVAGNARTALAIGRAQTVAILAASNRKLPVNRYSPSQVKLQVTNYGGSSKQQVGEMVRIQLALDKCINSEDASDALAVAICHLNQRHISSLISRESMR
jgi:crossover junction endodeoxyribonuclease RuvC